jgi:hypothetical protein
LSPLLFALFISDIGRLINVPDAQCQPLGVPLQQAQEPRAPGAPLRVTHALFAYDLVICDSSHEHMQLQLKRLEEFAIAKGLCVNVGKCATIVCKGDDTGAHNQMTLTMAARLKSTRTLCEQGSNTVLDARRCGLASCHCQQQ